MLVSANDRGIDDQILKVGIVGHGLEDAKPAPLPAPPAETPEDAVPLAERLRKIAPGRARADDPEHAFDKHSVVPPGRALLIRPAMINGAIRSQAASPSTKRSITPKAASPKAVLNHASIQMGIP